MNEFSHRDYFRRFKLGVQQYGEILTAHAFNGEKQCDNHPGCDVKSTKSSFLASLRLHGIAGSPKYWAECTEDMRIEVKSKLSPNSSGKAEVIRYSKTQIEGASRGKTKPTRFEPLTHSLVLLVRPGARAGREVDEEGKIHEAWLLTFQQVLTYRNATTRKGKSLSVREIRPLVESGEALCLKSMFDALADTPLRKFLS